MNARTTDQDTSSFNLSNKRCRLIGRLFDKNRELFQVETIGGPRGNPTIRRIRIGGLKYKIMHAQRKNHPAILLIGFNDQITQLGTFITYYGGKGLVCISVNVEPL